MHFLLSFTTKQEGHLRTDFDAQGRQCEGHKNNNNNNIKKTAFSMATCTVDSGAEKQ